MREEFGPPPVAAFGLADVIATSKLKSREARPPDFKQECEALRELAKTLADAPNHLAQHLVDLAMQLTGAGSAGLSLLETVDGEAMFRWVATAGDFGRHAGETLPRGFSPCGAVVDRNEALLMHHPVRHYPYIAQLRSPVCEVMLAPFTQGGEPKGTVWVVHHTEGKRFDLEDLRLLQSITGFASAAVAMAVLVGQLQDTNEQCRRLLAAANEAEARKDEFLAVVAHEMRNPLSPIKLSTHALKRQIHDPIQRKSLEIIERQTAQLSTLVDDLLDAASIRTGKVAMAFKPVLLQEVLARALEACQPVLERHRHDLRIDVPDEPIVLVADAVRLLQVLANLLNNAIKYTPAGGTLTLSAKAVHPWVEIEVHDSGVGISPEMLPRVFDMFMQVPAASRQQHGGLGIGLALVRQLVDMHGGCVEAHSDGPGQGTCFRVKLPVDASGAAA